MGRPPFNNFEHVLEDLLARGFESTCIFDIGSNSGEWSKSVQHLFQNSKFIFVEPQSEMEDSLKDFCKKNTGSQYFICGAGSENSQLTLTVWKDKLGTSFIPNESDVYEYAQEKRIVDVKTLNSLIEEYQLEIPNLVKLDVQGFELDVLKGASMLLGKTEIFILEVSLYRFEGMPIFDEIVSFMSNNGYVVYDFAGFSRRPYDGALGQCDVVFAKKSGALTSYQQWR